MPRLRILVLLLAFLLPTHIASAQPASAQPTDWLDAYREPAARLIGTALADDSAWERLAYLGDTFGPRLSGSPNLEAAIAWAAATMRSDGLEQVCTEPVMVPHWVRGRESVEILDMKRTGCAEAWRTGIVIATHLAATC